MIYYGMSITGVCYFRYTHTRDFPFNNVAFAFITLFELLTLEGWTEVRNMLERDTLANVVRNRVLYIYTGSTCTWTLIIL